MSKYNIFIFRSKCALFLRIYAYIFKNKIYSWNKCKNVNKIPYGHSCSFFTNKEKSRRVFNDYFVKNIPNEDHLSIQYIKKTLVSDFDEYYSFMAQVLRKGKKKYKIIGAGIFKCIYDNVSIKVNYFLMPGYIIAILKILYIFTKNYNLCCKNKCNAKVGDVVYLRRKILPDAFSHSHKFFKENNTTFSGVIFEFNSSESKYGLYFLSSFSNSVSALKQAMLTVFKCIASDTLKFYKLSIPVRIYYRFLMESLYANALLELCPKVIYGSLIDRPYSILLYKYKKPYQKICMHGDGFAFPPDPGPEYVHGDIFYGMNDIDMINMNHYGGCINTVKEVGFYRQLIKADSKGVSQDLMSYTKQYRSTILVVLNTVRVDKYFDIDLEYFESFLVEIIEQSKIHHDSLFVIKGKKGELDLLSQEISDRLSLPNNIYIVSCNMPYLLKYNHFEDLLEIANLVVSMHYASMTVWQSLSSKTPTIGYNYCIEDKVYFDNFPYFIVGKNEIGNAIRYWQGISKEQLDSFFYNINMETNIYNNRALNDMYMDMCRIVKQG